MNQSFDRSQVPDLLTSVSQSLSWSAVLALLFLTTVGLVLVWRGFQRHREWQHAERMKSLEMGLPLPLQEAYLTKAGVCLGIGVGVPSIAFGYIASVFQQRPETPVVLWVLPGVVSGLSVIGASILAGLLFRGGSSRSAGRSRMDALSGQRSMTSVKPEFDPDAFDVVGRRG